MRTAQLLDKHLETKGLSRADRWLYILVGGVKIPYVPIWPIRHFLIAHDLHHFITGYPTTILGEVYLLGWELASGGWARHNWWYWVKVIHVPLAFLYSPAGIWQALKAGSKRHNLYRFDTDELLEMEFDDAIYYVEHGALPAHT